MSDSPYSKSEYVYKVNRLANNLRKGAQTLMSVEFTNSATRQQSGLTQSGYINLHYRNEAGYFDIHGNWIPDTSACYGYSERYILSIVPMDIIPDDELYESYHDILIIIENFLEGAIEEFTCGKFFYLPPLNTLPSLDE